MPFWKNTTSILLIITVLFSSQQKSGDNQKRNLCDKHQAVSVQIENFLKAGGLTNRIHRFMLGIIYYMNIIITQDVCIQHNKPFLNWVPKWLGPLKHQCILGPTPKPFQMPAYNNR